MAIVVFGNARVSVCFRVARWGGFLFQRKDFEILLSESKFLGNKSITFDCLVGFTWNLMWF